MIPPRDQGPGARLVGIGDMHPEVEPRVAESPSCTSVGPIAELLALKPEDTHMRRPLLARST